MKANKNAVMLPDLGSLAAKIRSECAQAQQSGKRTLDQAQETANKTHDHVIAAGKLLIEARQKVGHGKWYKWLRANDIGIRTAQVYMQVAKIITELGEAKSAESADLTIQSALALGRGDIERVDKIWRQRAQRAKPGLGGDQLAQRLAEKIDHQLREQKTKIEALTQLADQPTWPTWPTWLQLRDALDRQIEGALKQRAEVARAVIRAAERYKLNPPAPGPCEDALVGDELSRAVDEAIRDKGPLRFIGLLEDYLALALTDFAEATDAKSAAYPGSAPSPSQE